MNLKRKILMSAAAVALPLGTGAFLIGTSAPASALSIATDTVTCNSFIGTISINPGLVVGGTTPTKIGVKGTLMGCTDGNSQVNAGGVFGGTVKGTLYGVNNDLLGLSGANPLTCKHGDNWKSPKPPVHCDPTGLDGNPYGSLTITWSAAVGLAGGTGITTAMPFCTYGAQFGLTPLVDAAGNHPYAGVTGTGNYGAFVLGAPAHSFVDSNSKSCSQSAIYAAAGQEDQSANVGGGNFTGDFGGSDAGASSATAAMTANDAAALLNGQEAKGSQSVITLGSSSVYFG